MLDRGGLRVHQQPMREVFKSVSKRILEQVRLRAPVGTGETLGLLKDAYGNTGLKPWGIGRVTGMTRHGAILNNGGRGRFSRYQSGPRRGRTTRNWFSGTIRLAAIRNAVNAAASRAAAMMQERWERGG